MRRSPRPVRRGSTLLPKMQPHAPHMSRDGMLYQRMQMQSAKVPVQADSPAPASCHSAELSSPRQRFSDGTQRYAGQLREPCVCIPQFLFALLHFFQCHTNSFSGLWPNQTSSRFNCAEQSSVVCISILASKIAIVNLKISIYGY